jgi:hypothetical protein
VLLVRHRRPLAAVVAPYMLPEFLKIMSSGHLRQPAFDLARQIFVGEVHVRELSPAERLAIPVRDANAVEHIHEPGHLAIGHVGVPVLTGIGTADVFAVFFQVRENTDLRVLASGIRIADRVSLNLAEKF